VINELTDEGSGVRGLLRRRRSCAVRDCEYFARRYV
jgi:hypothetical protein